MKNHAVAAGLSRTVIVNTCAVTSVAERQARQAIRKLRRKNPDIKIIVTGCSAQIKPDFYASMPEVDHVLGNDAKMKPESYAALQMTDDRDQESGATENLIPDPCHLSSDIQRAFVQVQNGCDHRCTFCIIPFGRGPSRSVPIGIIAEHVGALLAKGYHEFVFTGVDITSYGHDLPGVPTLGQMIRRVLALHPALPRLRLSSLDPAEMDDDLWRLIAEEPRLMPHLHLSAQAGDDMILKRMKRRHSRQDVLDICARARTLRPHMVFGADMIAGFPTETDAMFDNSLRLVEEAGLTWLHVFPYSPREGTPAALMPQVQENIRTIRAAQLRKAGEKMVVAHLQSLLGTMQTVLVESVKEGVCLGRTPSYAEVVFAGDVAAGGLVDLEILAMDGLKLRGGIKDKANKKVA
jgi:threonylcarbamoyladenosine tRNA methylthiotransferase MtaB